ncbi:FAD-dependent oxidoreductase [Paenibacillus sp. CAA11]|uniref:FAD-dependent oxidoreductase n=1 Tax=Paenibacillus sp. CAA11 TaxID=1532905 RepID=UPI000D3830C1|nr:FAD-dependent oxidoreductase [Paenibacillus sp. CAA11]AWB46331.1 FAD-dependent oxidoreductase [Paenibacillus sp. CAA11]
MTESRIPDTSELPQFPESLWRETTKLPEFPSLSGHIEADVAVIGAGITGITTAYLLIKEGLKVVLVDAGRILNGTTGHTTAKITAQHGMIYDELIQHFGEKNARLYYDANTEALSFIRQTVKEHQIDCGFKEEDAYLYADTEEDLKQLQKEWTAYEKLGLPGDWLNSIALPIIVQGAIRLREQAQFHPLHYLQSLLEYFTKHGGTVYENTTFGEQVEEESGRLVLKTEQGKHTIKCSYAVSASHYPFYDGGAMYFARLHADRSYIVAIEPETTYAGGMYINCGQPTRSIRSAQWEGKELLLIGGEGHKTGKSECTIKHYEALEQFGASVFGAKQIPFRWSAQDLVTIDKVPYIGQVTKDKPNVLIATGFAKWGMTSGTLSALMLRDRIMKRDNRYAELFTPQRFKADPGVKNLVVQNAQVAKDLVAGKIEMVHTKLDEVRPDEGAVVRHNGKRAGAYKDKTGKVHLVDTTCTHMGCELEWNAGERSWDCPCHGSRFSYTGEVMEGPATKPLKTLNPEAEAK